MYDISAIVLFVQSNYIHKVLCRLLLAYLIHMFIYCSYIQTQIQGINNIIIVKGKNYYKRRFVS
jgi:hypothetical protein